MPGPSELKKLLALVQFQSVGNRFEGLDEFRDLLDDDADGKVLKFLTKSLEELEGKRRGGIAFVVAEHFRKTGDLEKLKRLFATDDPGVKESVLNALWEKPDANPQLGPGIVAMAIEGTGHAAPEVRMQACSVLQNQCAWGVDVSAAVAPLETLLHDQNWQVRHRAAYAAGNLAKGKHDMSKHIAQLRSNVQHANMQVRDASAWALWQLSKSKHDISSAIPDLVGLLADREEYNEQRKKAAGALIHFAKKSSDNAQHVRQAIRGVKLDLSQKEVKKFVDQLAGLK